MSGEPTAYKMLLEYLDILYKRGSSARDNPQLAISGMNDWISCGALLDNKRGKPIEYLDAKGESVSSFLNHCWANTGDRGRAISMCLRSEFGRQLTSENYKPFVEQSAVERLLQLRNGKPADVLSSAANSSVTRTNR